MQSKPSSEADLTDSVAVDAKRILLRYGAPIAILDKVSESHRIEFAREIARTMLPHREHRLRELLAERGYTDAVIVTKKGRAKKGKSAMMAPPPTNVPAPTTVPAPTKAVAPTTAAAPPTVRAPEKARAPAKAKVAAKANVATKAKAAAKAGPHAKAGSKNSAGRHGTPKAARKKR